jgi:hypothetical protein
MKKIFSIVIAGIVLVVFLGCDRMETAVDTYKKVKDDAHRKSQEAAQEEARSIVNKELKYKLGPGHSGENEEADDKDKKQ